MKYLRDSFSSGANSKSYRDNWEDIFSDKNLVSYEVVKETTNCPNCKGKLLLEFIPDHGKQWCPNCDFIQWFKPKD